MLVQLQDSCGDDSLGPHSCLISVSRSFPFDGTATWQSKTAGAFTVAMNNDMPARAARQGDSTDMALELWMTNDAGGQELVGVLHRFFKGAFIFAHDGGSFDSSAKVLALHDSSSGCSWTAVS